MFYLIAFTITIFMAAYGNAMGRVVSRRQAAFDAGKREEPPTQAYRLTGNGLFALGALLTCVLIAFFVLDKPLPVIG